MRKKVKVIKKLAAAGLAAILACQVMGCGTGEKPTKDVSDEKVSEVKSQDTSKKEVLKVAVSSSSISETEGTAPMEEMFRGFEEQNNCEVEIVVIAHDGWADYLTKLQTMMVSGNGPDLYQNPHEGGRMANSLGLCAPLDDYISEHPEEWDEFEHYLEVLSKPDENGNKQYAWAIPDYYFVYNQWLYSFGTGYLDDDYKEVTFDSDASIELMKFCADAVKNGIAPTPDKNYDYLQQLVDGHVAMTNAGRWMINYCNSNEFTDVAVVRVPQKYSDRQEYAIGDFEVCSSTSKYDLAAACCFYTTGKDWVEKYANDTANIPSRTDVTLTDPTTDKGYINQDIFDTLPDGSYPMQNPTSFTEISNIFDRAFSSVMAGEISPEDGCKQAAEEMRAAVKANPD